MSSVTLSREPVPGFMTLLRVDGKTCFIECSGALDAPNATSNLQPELLTLHENLAFEQFKLVRLNVSAVTYMNSSAIKCFMAWFLKAERTPTTPYQIEVLYDPQATWQYVSFTTMGRIAPRILKMVALGKAAGV